MVIGARELLFDAGHRGLRQEAAVGPDDPLPIRTRRHFGVDVQGEQTWHIGHWLGSGCRREPGSEHFVEVGGRVRADEQDAPAGVGEGDGRGAGRRGLADPSLAGEEEDPGRVLHEGGSPSLSAAAAGLRGCHLCRRRHG